METMWCLSMPEVHKGRVAEKIIGHLVVQGRYPLLYCHHLFKNDDIYDKCEGLVVAKLPGWEEDPDMIADQRAFAHMCMPIWKYDCRDLFTDEEWKDLNDRT